MNKELKTLKDLKLYVDFVKNPNEKWDRLPLINSNDLKAEAVKWVKSLGNYKKNHFGEEILFSKDWIKHFFNLTEEDLK